MPAKIILVLAGIGLFALIIQMARLQLKPDAIVDLVEEIGGKGGGGKPNFAMGGGNDKNGITAAISVLKEKLTK